MRKNEKLHQIGVLIVLILNKYRNAVAKAVFKKNIKNDKIAVVRHRSIKSKKNNRLLSSTLKIERSNLGLFFGLDALEPIYGRFVIFNIVL